VRKKKIEKPPTPTPATRVHTRQARAQLAKLIEEGKPVLITKGEYFISALLIPLGFERWNKTAQAEAIQRARASASDALAEFLKG